MTVERGQTLSHYRLIEKIGEGGMGVVWKAEDTVLGRTVAIKVLPEPLAQSPERRARLEREAKLLASLNHSNIATIHGLEESEGVRFLVMEFVPGETLGERLSRGSLPNDEALSYCRQIAEALEAAHGKGVIHRDLKPANVKVTPEGKVKVLDFGLAKAFEVEESAPEMSQSPTLAAGGVTQQNVILGTAAYMSPEQARGKALDKRTDIWSLGCILYETLTGRQAFPGETVSDTIAAVLKQEPDWGVLPASTPIKVRDLLQRCLQKDSQQRLRDIGDARIEIGEALVRPLDVPPTPATAALPRQTARRRWIAWIVPAAVFLGVLAVTLYSIRQGFGPQSKLPSRKIMLAVLPFDNLSDDPEQEYFSDGMTEEMIARLGNLNPQRLGVIARTSVMQFKNTDKGIDEIGLALGVDYILEGSVRREADQVRITAQLIQVSDQTHLWAENYDRNLRDILALQSGVAQAVARQIQIELTPQQQTRLASDHPVNPEAYELYLKGRYHFNNWDFLKSTQYYEQAIQKDPAYAPAYAGLSLSYCYRWYGGDLPAHEAHSKSVATAMKALELDDMLGEAHSALGHVKFLYQWDWLGGLRECRRALELSPNSAVAHWEYALSLLPLGRYEEAIAEMKQALALDPFSFIMNKYLGDSYYFARQYQNALEQYRQTIELEPNFAVAYDSLGYVYEDLGNHEEAMVAYLKAGSLAGDSTERVQALQDAYRASGIRGYWSKRLEHLKEEAKQERVSSITFAAIYASLGQKDKAVDWLDKAYEEHEGGMELLKVDPSWDPLRDDPRFQDLLRRMKFPE